MEQKYEYVWIIPFIPHQVPPRIHSKNGTNSKFNATKVDIQHKYLYERENYRNPILLTKNYNLSHKIL